MANVISTTITATDRATAVVNKVNAAFEGMNRRVAVVSAAGERFGASVKKFGEVSGINRIASGFGDVGRRVVGAAESLGRFAPALAGITGAASIAGLAKLVETWTGFGARLGLDAQRINMSAASLHGLQGAARLAGSSAEALTDGMRSLGDNLTDAVGGRSPETVVMLSQLGIGFRDATTGGARLAQDVLPEIADKIAGIRNPAQQAMVATRLFGGAGEALLPFLRRGAAGIAEYNREALRYGVVNEGGVQAANAMREAQARMGLAIEGVGYSVAERLAPVLVPMLNRLSDWVAAHREDIAGFFTSMATRLQGWVDSDGPQHLIDNLEAVGAKINAVVGFLGGWEGAAVAVGLAMIAGPVASVISLTARLTDLLAFRPAAWLLRLLGLGAGEAAAIAAPLLAGGALAGQMNAPMLDEYGRELGNWGGAEGERNRGQTATVPGSGADESSGGIGGLLRRLFGGAGGVRGGGSGGGATPALPQGEQAVRARTAFDLFRSMGDPPNIAAARVANIQVESAGFNERAVGDSGQAYGLGQWHPDRQAQFAARYGHDIRQGTFEEQARFFHDDPDAQSQRAAAMLRNNPGMPAYDAAGVITGLQERPADVAGESHRRGVLAEQLERRFLDEDAARARIAPPAQAPPPIAAPPPPLAAPVTPPPGPQANAAGMGGQVGVNVAFLNPPPGLRMTTTAEGNVTVRAPRIDYAMPGWLPG